MALLRLNILQTTCILIQIAQVVVHASPKQTYDGLRWNNLMASEDQMKKINHLYTAHYMRAANGLLCAIGNQVYNEASLGTKLELRRCIARINKDDMNQLKNEARCVLEAYNMLDKEKLGIKWIGAFGVRRMKRRAMPLVQARLSQHGRNKFTTAKVIDFVNQNYVQFRERIAQKSPMPSKTAIELLRMHINDNLSHAVKNDAKKRYRPNINVSSQHRMALSHKINFAKVQKLKNEERRKQATAVSSRRRWGNAAHLVSSAEREADTAKFERLTMNRMPNLIGFDTNKSPVAAFAKTVTELIKGDDSGKTSWKDTYAKIEELDYQLKTSRKIEDENRAFDSVLGKISGSFALAKTDREAKIGNKNIGPLQDLQDMNALIDQLRPSEKKNFEFLSPKFAPLIPSEDASKRTSLLSPTFFSFFKDESPNNIASIPHLLNATGWNPDDRDALLDIIMEASGARVQVEQTLRGVSGLADWQDVAQAMIDANLRMNTTWTKFLSSLTKMQKIELDIKGFSFASHDQIEHLYLKDDSYYKGTWQNDIPLEEYKSYNDVDQKRLLRQMVSRMEGNDANEMQGAMRSWPKRMKQRVLSPFAFVNSILVPSIFGYTILSPNMFSTSILSPAMLNLELLTPRAFVPVILGPRVLSPRILGPRVFVPQILLANLLSPAIVRPVLLSPFILTPLVLSPGILAPSALGGRVLSPALLSPAILSPGAINADVLSPSLLSNRRRKRSSQGLWLKRIHVNVTDN